MNKNSYRDFYELASEKYAPEEGPQYYRHDRFFNVRRLADKAGGKLLILDVGCGNGYQIGPLAEKHTVYGLDISESNVQKALSRGIKARVYDAEDPFPFENGFFDVLVCSELLEHLFSPEKVLDECYRVLNTSGSLIVTVPNLYCLRNRLSLLIGGGYNFIEYPGITEHIRFFSIRGMRNMLGQAGFKVLHFRGQHFSMNFDWPFKLIWYLHGGNKGLKLLIRTVTLGKIRPEIPGLILQFYIFRFLGWLFPGLSPGIILECKKYSRL